MLRSVFEVSTCLEIAGCSRRNRTGINQYKSINRVYQRLQVGVLAAETMAIAHGFPNKGDTAADGVLEKKRFGGRLVPAPLGAQSLGLGDASTSFPCAARHERLLTSYSKC